MCLKIGYPWILAVYHHVHLLEYGYVGHTPFSDTPRCFLLPMWSNWNNHTWWDGLPQGSPTWLVFQLTLRYPEQSFPGGLWLMAYFFESVMNLTLCQGEVRNLPLKCNLVLMDNYPLVKKITIFNGKTHYKWPFSIVFCMFTRGYPFVESGAPRVSHKHAQFGKFPASLANPMGVWCSISAPFCGWRFAVSSVPYAPWCWNMYLHLPQKLPSFVGK